MTYEFVALLQFYDLLITLIGIGSFVMMASSAFPELNKVVRRPRV